MAEIYSADSTASPEAVWSLIAEPGRWAEWAPHVRGAWGLGSPEVEEGRLGVARLFGVLPVPARITEVAPGEHWSWHVPPLTLRHSVMPLPDGARVFTALQGPGPLVRIYGPVVGALMRRLARVAERRSG